MTEEENRIAPTNEETKELLADWAERRELDIVAELDAWLVPYVRPPGEPAERADVPMEMLRRARDKITALDDALAEQGILLKDQRKLIDKQAEDLIALKNWWHSLGQPYYQEKFGKQLARAMEIMTDLREALAAQVDIPVRHSAMMEPET